MKSTTAFAGEEVDYVDITFQPGGFTDSPEIPSAYFGAPTPEKDRLWTQLYDGDSITQGFEDFAYVCSWNDRAHEGRIPSAQG